MSRLVRPCKAPHPQKRSKIPTRPQLTSTIKSDFSFLPKLIFQFFTYQVWSTDLNENINGQHLIFQYSLKSFYARSKINESDIVNCSIVYLELLRNGGIINFLVSGISSERLSCLSRESTSGDFCFKLETDSQD